MTRPQVQAQVQGLAEIDEGQPLQEGLSDGHCY
jgi:hypothetical protein